MQRRRRFRKGSAGSYSTLSLLRKEVREGHLRSFFGGSSSVVSSYNTAPDPLLSSFMYNSPLADASKILEPRRLDKGSSVSKSSKKKVAERYVSLPFSPTWLSFSLLCSLSWDSCEMFIRALPLRSKP